jgi:drug/metabolite transporter (DMT)-like permease
MIWPIAVIVLSNIVYHVSSKETPGTINPFASLTVTYLIGAAFSALLYFALNRGGNLLREYRGMNWTSFALGLAVVGLEAGSLYMYKAGWNISSGHLVHSIILSICLVFVGYFAYRESISATKVAGIVICMLGLWLINK